MTYNKISRLLLPVLLVGSFASCSDDKGNYTYSDKQVFTIEGLPTETARLSGSDYIDMKPVVTSSLDGVLTDDNKKYTFLYEWRDGDGNWQTVNETKDLYMLTTLSSGRHTFRFSVTDTETGVKGLQLFYVQSTTVTSEGWLVLCNVGSDERVRLDMLSQIDNDRILPTYDVLRKEETIPDMHHARSLGFYSNQTATGNKLVIMADDGSYLIPTADNAGYTEITELNEAYDLKNALFISATTDHLISFVDVPSAARTADHDAVLSVSSEGNLYVWNTAVASSAFETAANTSTRGGDPEFKVSPYIGTTLERPHSTTYGAALLYDTDNHRFIGWDGKDKNEARKQTVRPLDDPSNKKFSFNTGSMDLVCMVNTAFSGGVTYCIMQDGSKRHIYAINLSSDDYTQEGAYTDIQAPDFTNATTFAASSQYPVIYYGYKNKVYAYNYATTDYTVTELPSTEEVTKLTFHRFDHPFGLYTGICKSDDDKYAIYSARENRLIVASYDNAAEADKGGTLRFYDVATPGTALTLTPGWEYTGYGHIVDVKYKEIR